MASYVEQPGALPAGTYTFNAAYSGNVTYTASSSGATAFTVSPSPTVSRITVSPNPITVPATATLAATVTAAYGHPNGAVSFFYRSHLIGTVQCTTACGTIQVSTAGLPAGEYLISAIFSGSANYSTSTANSVVVTVE
jgi:large repetitive protein